MNRSENSLTAWFGILGNVVFLIVAGVFLYNFLFFIWLYTRKGNLVRYKHTPRDGREPWALVTGASDGIGSAYARALAEAGFNVVLHGRNPVKLDAVVHDLKKHTPDRLFRTLVADAGAVRCKNCSKYTDHTHRGNNGEARLDDARDGLDFARIKAELQDLHLTVLINNVGGGPKDPSFAPLQQYPAAYLSNFVSVDTLFPLHLTHALLPVLIESKPALLINMGSMTDLGLPYMGYYGASKAFNMTLTKSLGQELALQGHGEVEVLGIRVSEVTGVTWRKDKPNILMPTAETMAASALGMVGSGRRVVFGYWGHALLVGTVDMLPQWVFERVAGVVLQRLLRWMEEKERTARKDA